MNAGAHELILIGSGDIVRNYAINHLQPIVAAHIYSSINRPSAMIQNEVETTQHKLPGMPTISLLMKIVHKAKVLLTEY